MSFAFKFDPSIFGAHRGASFSDCKRYRYLLWRAWDVKGPMANFIMLNPSTADDENDDPTITRISARAKAAGFGSLMVTNAYAFRATEPVVLKKLARAGGDPIGPLNDAAVMTMATRSAGVVVGWGAHIDQVVPGRQQLLFDLLRGAGVKYHALGWNAAGTPKHPLYVGYDIKSEIGL